MKKKVAKDRIQEREDLEMTTAHGSNLDKTIQNGKPLGNKTPGGSPIEFYKSNTEADIIKAMHYVATQCAANAKKDGFDIFVSDLQQNYPVTDDIRDSHFCITDKESGISYTIQRLGNNILYRYTEEYEQICQDLEDKIPGSTINSFYHHYDNPENEIDVYSVNDRDDCMFIIYSIISSIAGKSYEDVVDFKDNVNEIDINESARIRKHNKLGTDGLIKNSKKFHEAKYGTPEENAFKQEVEAKQKQDGTVGALDQQQQEAVQKPILPNVHRLTESNEVSKFDYKKLRKLGYEDIEYEPGDKVVVGAEKHSGVVTYVWDTVDQGQMIAVLLDNGGGMAYVTFDDIEPNPAYPNQVFSLGMPYTTYEVDRQYGLDMRTRINDDVLNPEEKEEQFIKSLPREAQKPYRDEQKRKHRDMNERNILCNIICNYENGTYKLDYDYCYASLKDILEGKDTVKVVNESGVTTEWPIENIQVEPENWPYAVVVDGEEGDEPLRKIRIDPTGYVSASDGELVDCIVGGKLTKMYKKNIKIIS